MKLTPEELKEVLHVHTGLVIEWVRLEAARKPKRQEMRRLQRRIAVLQKIILQEAA